MRTLATLLGLALLVLALAFVWMRSGDRTGDAVARDAPDARTAVVPEPSALEPAELADSAARPSTPARVATETPAPPAAAAPDPEPAEPERIEFRITARVVTTEGDPIEGAEVVLGDRTLATSNEEGDIDGTPRVAEAAVSSWSLGNEIVVRAGGYLPVPVRAAIRADTVTRLGTIELEPAERVDVLVLDLGGRPVPEVPVVWHPVSEWPEDADLARKEGLSWHAMGGERPRGRTDAEGRCVVPVPLRPGFLSAETAVWTEVFTPLAGERLEWTLTLPIDLGQLFFLSGVVLGPDGEPRAAVTVEVSWLDPASSEEVEWWERSRTKSDEVGAFELAVPGAGPLILRAYEPEGETLPASLENLAPGSRDLVLRLGAPRWIEVAVVDPDGRPISWSNVRMHTTLPVPHMSDLLPGGEPGVARVPLPAEEFTFEAFAPGFTTRSVGPLDPGALEDRFELELQPGAALRGRVVFEGRGVPGARVGLAQASEPGRKGVQNVFGPQPGFAEWPLESIGYVPLDVHDATTDGDGRFVASLEGHDRDWRAVLVVAEGFPPTIRGPFEWPPGTSHELEIELERAGALEGRVLVAPGKSPAGRLVTASNGWGIGWTAEADDEGRYRFAELPPGPFQVRPSQPPMAAIQNIPAGTPEEGSVEWDCTVVAGETTHHDLDLTDEGAFVLRGRLDLDSLGTAQSSATLLRSADNIWSRVAWSPLDEGGEFEIALIKGGRYHLKVDGMEGTFEQSIELARGTTDWSFSCEPAQVSFRCHGEELPAVLALRWNDGSGLSFRTGLRGPAGGETSEPLLVPPGRVRVMTRWLERGNELEPWREIDLAPGEKLVLDYP